MKIRKATIKEVEAVQKVAYALRKPEIPWADWHYRRNIRTIIRQGKYFIAEVCGKIVGIMSIGRHKTLSEYEVETLAVCPSYQGKGVGIRLVNFAKSIARRHRVRRLTVSSLVLFKAKEFYLKMGFRIKSSGFYKGRKWYEYIMSI